MDRSGKNIVRVCARRFPIQNTVWVGITGDTNWPWLSASRPLKESNHNGPEALELRRRRKTVRVCCVR